MSVLSRFSGLPKQLNPVMRPLARWAPPLAVLHHRGRRSGRPYDTPVQAFRTRTGFIVGLAYDPNSSWALNILAAEGGEMTRGGHHYILSRPRRRGAEARAELPAPIAFTMRRFGIDDYLEFDATRT